MKCAIVTVFFALACASIALAKDAPPLGDPAVEARLKTLSQDLRCLVCQNTTLADSNAALASDLRNEVRSLIIAGKSDEEIRAHLVARYGDFVLYTPPLKTTTILLWVGPFVLFAGAIAVGVIVLRRRRPRTQGPSLEGEERARLAALLGESE